MAEKRKRKILFINGNLNVGGVEQSLLNILKHLDYSKYKVDLLILNGTGTLLDQVPESVGVFKKHIEDSYGPLSKVLVNSLKNRDYFSLKFRLILMLEKVIGVRAYRFFIKIMGLETYDISIGFRSGISSIISCYGVSSKKKIVWWHHGEIDVGDNYPLEIKPADQLISVSEFCKSMISQRFPVLKSKIEVLSNLINPKLIMQLSAEYIPVMDKTFITLVSVGRLSSEKRWDLAVEAASFLKKNKIRFNWYLIGDGVLKEDLQNMIALNHLADCFHLVGELANPYPYIAGADLLVHPSFVESQGLVLLEALALGVPVLAVKSGGPEEFIENGINGFLCEKDPEDFKNRLLKCIELSEYLNLSVNELKLPDKYSESNIMSRLNHVLTS